MRLSKLALGELFASIRERPRRSEHQSHEEGAQIMRRLQELLDVRTTTQKVETPSANASSENETAWPTPN
jgi:hypothetical protein